MDYGYHICLCFQFNGQQKPQFLVSVYTSASNVFIPTFNVYMGILTINWFIYLIYLFSLLLFLVIKCYFDFSQNFYCHGISISASACLLGFFSLDLSTWIVL